MTEATNNFSASDMATAAAQGFRDGQKVALAGATNNASYAYDLIDRYLRNNMDDDMYAEYSELLDSVYAAPTPEPASPISAQREGGDV